MGASLTMIDRHYGHLARDGREHAIKLLDALNAPEFDPWTLVDARWTPKTPAHRAITCDTVPPANRTDSGVGDASRGVARVVSDVSVVCPRAVVRDGDARE